MCSSSSSDVSGCRGALPFTQFRFPYLVKRASNRSADFRTYLVMGLNSANRKPHCPSCCMLTIVLAAAMALLTTAQYTKLLLQVSSKIKHYEVKSGYFLFPAIRNIRH